jgi:radical SAM protein with 4Fe4S-binding SPASM domain
MNAQEHPRIRLEGRTNLAEAIPLDTPIHVFIDPSAACNFKCKFCFNADKSRTHHEIMPFPLFVKIIDDLKKFPHKLKAIRLYGYGDPLMNARLPDMVEYTKRACVTDFVEFTTNGWWLKPDLNKKLVEAGLDAITISVPGMNEEKIKEVCGQKVNLSRYITNIIDFYLNKGNCRVHVKLTNYNLTHGEAEMFYDIFGDFCDEISIDNVVPIWPGLKGDIKEPDKNIYMREIVPAEACPYIFYHMTINANGDVSTCFVDWEHKNLLGNAKTESIVDIWRGEKLRNMRINMLEGTKEGICIGCNQLRYGQPDSIDEHREEILGRFL